MHVISVTSYARTHYCTHFHTFGLNSTSMSVHEDSFDHYPPAKVSCLFPVQVLHGSPHLVCRESTVPRDDLHDSEVREFIEAPVVDVQVEVCVGEITVGAGDVFLVFARVNNALVVAAHHKPVGIAWFVPVCDPRTVMSNTCAMVMMAMEDVGRNS